jgi:predicted PurR-regulated permease PerM
MQNQQNQNQSFSETEPPSSATGEVTRWTTSQVAFATVFVVCVFLAFWLLYRFRNVVFLFFVSIVVGTAIRPGVEWLRRRGISRRSGIILIYLLFLGLLLGLLGLTLPLLADQATQFSQSVPEYYNAVREALFNSGNRLLQNIGFRLPSLSSFFADGQATTEEMFDQVTQTFLYTNLALRGILSVAAVFLVAFYWTQESNLFLRTLIRLVPASRRDDVREFFDLAETRMGGYIRGQAILSLTVGVAAFIAYSLIGLPYVLVLAIMAGLMEMVPVFGPLLGAIPALLVALSTAPEKAIWVLVLTGVIQLLENAWLVPRIMKDSMGISPIIILLSLVAFSSVFGFPGALLALPLAALIQLIVNRLIVAADDAEERSQTREMSIQELIEENRELLRKMYAGNGSGNGPAKEIPESARVEINSIAQELDGLLTQLEKRDGMA